MNLLLPAFVLIPLAGLLVSLLLPASSEKLISRTVVTTMLVQLVGLMVFVATWAWVLRTPIDTANLQIFGAGHYEFAATLYLDHITALFALAGAFLALLVCLYSRIYLHREAGYKRFFASVLLFYTGYNLVVFAGNLETIFIGWEVLGISSFLLVAFYRERYLPARNALKVFTVYRFGDVGLILSIWACHYIFHTSPDFAEAAADATLASRLAEHPLAAGFLALMLLLAAAAKSAQLPFSSWLPRAMEGPTPSSAIFYGSLSVHMGVFLLLRTAPLWEPQFAARLAVGAVGLCTAILATGIARVQPSVKAQIAYSSIAQLGLMFIELALGLHTLALVHFAGNAFLRTYQLLVSPSVVSYLIREQFYQFEPRRHSLEDSLPKRLENSLYLLCLKEWHLDVFTYRLLWSPLKRFGRKLASLSTWPLQALLVLVFAFGVSVLLHRIDTSALAVPAEWLSIACALMGLGHALRGLSGRVGVTSNWGVLVASHFWLALAVGFNDHFPVQEALLYLGGIAVAGFVGWLCLRRLAEFEGTLDLAEFNGHAVQHPRIGFVFLLCCLGLLGFPITPTFVGEDLLFSHIRSGQTLLLVVVSLTYVAGGLAVVRAYAKLFLGPRPRLMRGAAYRAS
jgi:NADH:ubiquinone oxidoreductase subunit 5 (subunit L)/multisubunit Na+/H+ antiporter MnhA subunit